jgi:subtilisin family serine protease
VRAVGEAGAEVKALAVALAAAALTGDPLSEQQWGLHRIGAPAAWSVATGAGVKVAVVDSGVNLGAPDLARALAPGWDFVQRDDEPADTNGHGSHIAGVIAARANDGVGMAGVAPGATLIPVRVLGNTNRGTCPDSAAGLGYAVQAGARVVNFSVGQYEPCPAARAVIDGSPQTLFVVSAMNDGADVDAAPTYPCAEPSPNLICVAATDAQDRLSAISNYGARTVDLGAPGEGILSTVLKWGPLETLLEDGFEAPLGWVAGGTPGTWMRSPFDQRSGNWSLVGSPPAAPTDGFARLNLDLRGRRDCAARVWVRRGGAELWVETSADGLDWSHRPDRVVGHGPYEELLVDLAQLEGRAGGGMGFRIRAGAANPATYVAIDDVEVICVPPLEQYTGAADEYGHLSGTSFAAPHVAGVAALLLSREPGLTGAAVRERILSTVDPVPGLAGKTVSGGRLNAARALGVATAPAPPAAAPPDPLAAIAKRLTRRSLLRRGGFVARGLTAPGPGRATVTLRGLAKGKRRVVHAGGYAVKVRLTRAGRKRLRRSRRVRTALVLRFVPAAGAPELRRVRVTME